MIEVYFDLSGRLGRWRYFIYWVFLWIVVPVLALLGIPAVDHARYPKLAAIAVVVMVGAFWVWAGFAMTVKRLHDLDRTGWHYVWMFLLPGLLTGGFTFVLTSALSGEWTIGYGQSLGIVPLLATLYLLLAPGTEGINRFGYPP